MKKQEIHFANSAISIEFDGEIPAHLVDFLFRYVPDAGSATPHVSYRLVMDNGKNNLVLYCGDKAETSYESEADMAVYLMERACFHLADRSQGGLLLHAAAMHRKGYGVLIPGISRSGKSSLTAWLSNQDFDYMTDELSFVPLDTKEILAFSRPLSLKKDVRPLFRNLLATTRQSGWLLRTYHIDLFAPQGLLSGTIINHTPLRCIVFPHFQSNADFNLQKLSKARSSLLLMQCLINARNLDEHGFPEIVRISQTIPAFLMTYSSFQQIGQSIEDLF